MYIEGRPPVTNLYSSALFISWGAVLLCFLTEKFLRLGIASAMGSLIGFGGLVVAHNLSIDSSLNPSGDTMEMMRAVLDSNFWLATHVVTITIGYSTTFLAGFLGIAYVFSMLFRAFVKSSSQGKDLDRTLVSMIFGITCFSLFFSLVGTVLVGIWADQSWGRFWGWDAKENGALLIVIWNANFARPLGWNCQSAWLVRTRYFWQCGYRLVLVWYKYARRWIAFLWIYGQSLRAPDGFLRLTVSDHWASLFTRFFLFV